MSTQPEDKKKGNQLVSRYYNPKYGPENNAKHRMYKKIMYICGQKIQNDYLQASHITTIFISYQPYNTHFWVQKERYVTETE